MTWGIEDFMAGLRGEGIVEPPADAAAKYALEQMRRQGRIPPAGKVEPLEAFDRLVLTAINQLRGRGHSVNITATVAEMKGARVLPASILASVRSLEKRGLVWSRFGRRKTSPDRKRTQYFTITLAGGRALGISDVPPIPQTRRHQPVTAARGPTWDDVLHKMTVEAPPPSYDELIRWCARYPQYSEDLASHFLICAVQCIQGGEPQHLIVLSDEERLSGGFDSRATDYARELLRRQGRLMPPPPIKSLEPFDRHVLAAVYELRGKSYIANINDKVTQASGARVLPASTSASLNRLEKLGLAELSSEGRETYFKITIGGKRALAKTK